MYRLHTFGPACGRDPPASTSGVRSAHRRPTRRSGSDPQWETGHYHPIKAAIAWPLNGGVRHMGSVYRSAFVSMT